MKIGFLVNDCLPDMGLPCSGQGLRAWGLLQGLRSNGVDATAIIRHSTLSTRMRRWPDLNQTHFPDWVRVVDAKTIEDVICDVDAMVFHNWAAVENLKRPQDSETAFIYDFFSATLVEHSFISSDPEHTQNVRNRKIAAIDQSTGFFANGPGRQAYATDFLARHGRSEPVADIPTCLPWLGEARPKKTILIGGYQQRWTKDVTDDALVAVAKAFPEYKVVSVGRGHHYHFGADPKSRNAAAELPDNLISYDVLPFQDYLTLNTAAAVFVDLAPLNEERRLSFSTRGVLSVAAGCPIIHNTETDLGEMLNSVGAGVTLSEDEDFFQAEVLIDKIRACLTVDRYDACKALWATHFDARKGAETLAQLV